MISHGDGMPFMADGKRASHDLVVLALANTYDKIPSRKRRRFGIHREKDSAK